MTVDVRGLDHVGVMTTDIDAAVSWYAEVFGGDIEDRWADPSSGMSWAHVRLGGLRVEFVQRPSSATGTGGTGLHHLALAVPDLPDAVERVVAAGGAAMTPPAYFERHDMDWCFVTDPFGNVIEFLTYRDRGRAAT